MAIVRDICIIICCLFFVGCSNPLDEPGCTNPDATNFKLSATQNDGSCLCEADVLRIVDSPFDTARDELQKYLGDYPDVLETYTFENQFILSIDYGNATQVDIATYATNAFELSRYDGIYELTNDAHISLYVIDDSARFATKYTYDVSLYEYVEEEKISFASQSDFYETIKHELVSC